METHIRDRKIAVLSFHVCVCVAAYIPTGIPHSVENTVPKITKTNVYLKRIIISSNTGLCVMMDEPKSPCKTPETYLHQRTKNGSLSPRSSRSASTCSSVADAPSSILAGSPGVKSINNRTISEIPISVGISISNRFPMYLSNSFHQPFHFWILCYYNCL